MKAKIIFSTLLFVILLGFIATASAVSVESPYVKEPINTRSGLINAINDAKDGDTLYVTDIDFNLSGTGAVNEIERIIIDKSITIKSAKENEKAVFYGASFILDATKMAGASDSVRFVDIFFDGGIDGENLTEKDWELSYDSMGEVIGNHPLKAQYAISCKGNLNLTLENCEFNDYMYEYGPAINAFYSDYTSNPAYQIEYGSNLSCSLNITLNKCEFNSNSALYGGGAIFLDANKNIELLANDTIFIYNRSGFNDFSTGGGALCISKATAVMNNCTLISNVANYHYGGEKSTYDQVPGGAISCTSSSLIMNNCIVADNISSLGGGVSIVSSNAEFNGCVFAKNQAIPRSESFESELGIASNKGLGGALYLNDPRNVKIVNTDIYSNYAQNAFGGIFAYYNPLLTFDTNSVEIKFSSIANNICQTQMQEYKGYGTSAWLWFSYPGDFLDISYMKIYASIIIDKSFEADYPRYEEPTEENNYNYFASPIKANDDGYIITLTDDLYEHKSLSNAPVVPSELANEFLGTDNTVLVGEFTIGSNAKDAVFNLYYENKLISTKQSDFFEELYIPQEEELGYTYSPWKQITSNQEIEEGKIYIVGNRQGAIDIYTEKTANVYKVTFVTDFSENQTEQKFGTPINFPKPEKIKGYTFKGWYTKQNGEGEAVAENDIYKIAGDKMYYAYYQKNFPVLAIVIPCISVLVVIPIIAGGTVAACIFIRRKKRKPQAPTQDKSIDNGVDVSALTPREGEVLKYLLQGKTRSDIGKLLFVSENTIKKQITSIYQKLSVSTRNELFARFNKQ